jgi:hypothetical protein
MLNIALKEWSVVCDLLLEGRLTLLLRKGGIHEDEGPGVFRLKHDNFALLPSWAHQKPHMIKSQFRDRVEIIEEPAELPIAGIAKAVRIWQVPSRAAFDTLDDLHCWSTEQIDMRFDYKPQNPLYLVAVRAARLAEPQSIENYWEYGGCKSWVPLREQDAIQPGVCTPVLDDRAFQAIIRRVNQAFEQATATDAGADSDA